MFIFIEQSNCSFCAIQLTLKSNHKNVKIKNMSKVIRRVTKNPCMHMRACINVKHNHVCIIHTIRFSLQIYSFPIAKFPEGYIVLLPSNQIAMLMRIANDNFFISKGIFWGKAFVYLMCREYKIKG